MVGTLEIHPLQVKLELLHSVLHGTHTHTHTTAVTACDWVTFNDIISFHVMDKHKSTYEDQKDIYCLYIMAESVHECWVITLQSHNADPFDTAAITVALL